MTVPPPVGLGRDTAARKATRAALVDVLWDERGRRRLPRERNLVAAMSACDPRDVWWVCEASSAGPVYLLPTREWIAEVARALDAWKVRSVLEVAAGDGFLSACLRAARPKLRVVATDDHSWRRPAGRMNAADERALAGVPLSGIVMAPDVEKLSARAAVDREQPDLVLVSWAPPGLLVERCIRGPARFVLDISVDGDVCGNGAHTWRFHKELLFGPLEDRALCRLDARPDVEPRQTRVTLYYARRHEEHGVDRGHWLGGDVLVERG